MTHKCFFYCVLAFSLSMTLACNSAFGWAGNIHSCLCQRTFDDPVVTPLLSGIDQSAIENYILEPTQACHDAQWITSWPSRAPLPIPTEIMWSDRAVLSSPPPPDPTTPIHYLE